MVVISFNSVKTNGMDDDGGESSSALTPQYSRDIYDGKKRNKIFFH